MNSFYELTSLLSEELLKFRDEDQDRAPRFRVKIYVFTLSANSKSLSLLNVKERKMVLFSVISRLAYVQSL